MSFISISNAASSHLLPSEEPSDSARDPVKLAAVGGLITQEWKTLLNSWFDSDSDNQTSCNSASVSYDGRWPVRCTAASGGQYSPFTTK